MIDAQLFLCTHERNLTWLNCCLRSAQKYWHSVYPPMIVATPQCASQLPKVVTELKSYVSYEPKWPNYDQGQSYIRLTADSYVTSNWIMFLDIDCLFTRACSAEDFSEDNRPTIVTESVSDLIRRILPQHQNELHNCIDIVQEFLGVKMTNDYTRRSPHMFHRSSLRKMRTRIEKEARRPLADTVSQAYPDYWMEWNLVGSYCEAFENDCYDWKDISTVRTPIVRRFTAGAQDPAKGKDHEDIRKILLDTVAA